jgi:hypothetical protein
LRILATILDYTLVNPLLVALFFALSLLAAQPKPPAAKAVPGLGVSAEQDKAIEAAIRAKLAKSKIGKDGLTVHVQGGVAYWEGSTSVVQHKGAATRMAKTAGAKKVVNHIQVSEAARQAASGNLAQGRRRVQVKRGEPRSQ